MPKLDVDAVPQTNATGYPPPHDGRVQGRWYRRLGPVAGLAHMGVSHCVLRPGAWSSQRHWHESEDELVVMLEGEAVLVDDHGETVLRAGDVAAFPAGEANGHHLQNRSERDCVFMAIGAGDLDGNGSYSDIDMRFEGDVYLHKDGAPFAQRLR